MRRLPDQEGLDIWEGFAGLITVGPRRIALSVRSDWVAIPASFGASELSSLEGALLGASQQAGDGTLYITSLTQQSANDRSVIEIDASPTDFESAIAGHNWRQLEVGIFPASRRWLVYASEADFSVVMGEHRLVATLVGCDSSIALERFRKYEAEWAVVPPYIRALAQSDWSKYEHLPPGGEFVIEWPESG